VGKTIQTKSYQDPLEGAFEKNLPWSATFSKTDENATIHLMADDYSDRQFALPVGVILELAEAILFQRSISN